MNECCALQASWLGGGQDAKNNAAPDAEGRVAFGAVVLPPEF